MRFTRWFLKPAVFLACLWPALRLAAGAAGWHGATLGADPVAALLHGAGRWGLNFLMITLCMTPLRVLSGSSLPLRFRRMFGLFSFFYLVMHLLIYVVLDQSRDLHAVLEDVLKRPYITIGMLALAMMVPLAATSTQGAMRRLGRRWTTLHRLIYPIAVLGVWHFWWQVKRDLRQPILYAAGLALLLGYRYWRERRSQARRLSVSRLAATDGA
ncbi:MAG: sulfoxide reductase heme-binding subunit YedZ [Gammaproteobacteria bacterium]|nr:sulfoxide reductase heme-binding subunit YedZ [Gammaproteobacteria bacterium]